MTINSTGGIDYTQWLPGTTNVSYTNSNNATVTQAANSGITLERTAENDFFISDSGETCTDGEDDGKIGFFSACGNIIKGAAKGLVNGIKGMFCDQEGNFSLGNTLKSAALIGACFIPLAGPYIAAGLCIYGVAKGSTGIIKSISTAANAETDAEAKEAFQSLGSNTLVTGLSAYGLKGSMGAIAKQSGFSSVIGKDNSILSTLKTKGGLKVVGEKMGNSFTEYYGSAYTAGKNLVTSNNRLAKVASGTKEVLKKGATGTGENLLAAGKSIKNKTSEMYKNLTGKQGTGSAEQIAKSIGTKKNPVSANDVENALNNGGELPVGKKTYQITKSADGTSIEYALKQQSPTTSYSVEESVKTENLTLDNLKSQSFTKSELKKIQKLKVNASYTTNNGTKVTNTGSGYTIETPKTGIQQTVYEGVETNELAKIVGKKNATKILKNIKSGEINIDKISNGKTTYTYNAGDKSLTKSQQVSQYTAKANNFIDGIKPSSEFIPEAAAAVLSTEIEE